MSAKSGGKSAWRPKLRRQLKRLLWAVLIVLVALPFGLTLIYTVAPPPITPLMVIRLFQGEGLSKDWVPLEEMARDVPSAVIAAEDNRFCEHHGIDFEALAQVYEEYKDGKRLRGASTISMQTAKNLFLWPDRSLIRKGLEAYLTVMIELVWSKRRILEVYLNIVELSGGIYGMEAAAQANFGRPAAKLTRRQASLLAAVLPNPRQRSAAKPSGAVSRQANRVSKRIGQLGPLLDCF